MTHLEHLGNVRAPEHLQPVESARVLKVVQVIQPVVDTPQASGTSIVLLSVFQPVLQVCVSTAKHLVPGRKSRAGFEGFDSWG